MGAGVKQSTNISTANAASQRRLESSGASSSKTRGWRGPNTSSIPTVSTVQTIHDVETNDSPIKHGIINIVTTVLRTPKTADEWGPPISSPDSTWYNVVDHNS